MDLRAQTDAQSATGGDAPEVLNKAASTVQNVLDSADQAVDRTAEKVKQVTGQLRTGQEKVVEAVHRATSTASEWKNAITERPEQWMESAAQSIRAQPFTSVAVAFAVGWIYGRFFR